MWDCFEECCKHFNNKKMKNIAQINFKACVNILNSIHSPLPFLQIESNRKNRESSSWYFEICSRLRQDPIPQRIGSFQVTCSHELSRELVLNSLDQNLRSQSGLFILDPKLAFSNLLTCILRGHLSRLGLKKP